MTSDDPLHSTPLAPISAPSFLDALHYEDADPHFAERLNEIRLILHDEEERSRPFLSVLLRTRGQRLETLKDSLLCLAAQTDQDFEVIVIEHDAELDDAAEVRAAVSMQAAEFRERIQIIEVMGGGRSRPLNDGIMAASGRYIAVFDDDDLLFGDWVEQFRRYSGDGTSRLLRAQVATQRAEPEQWSGGNAGLRTLSWPKAEYARNFDQLQHMLVNHSPFMSIAFPRVLFSKFGLRFDENLPVCEDWDVILRGSLILGVQDVPALTSIYRRWHSGESSYTEHSSREWLDSEARVVSRVNRSSIILPPGSVVSIRDLLSKTEEYSGQELALVLNSLSWKVTRPLRVVKRRWDRVKGTILHLFKRFR